MESMTYMKLLLMLVFYVATVKPESENEQLASTTKIFKPTVLRTELRFGRNLDPDKVRVFKLKSKNNEDVEILVGQNSRRARAGGASSYTPKSTSTKNPTIKLSDYPHTTELLKQDYEQRKIKAEARHLQDLQKQIQKAESIRQEEQLLRPNRTGRKISFPDEQYFRPSYIPLQSSFPDQYTRFNEQRPQRAQRWVQQTAPFLFAAENQFQPLFYDYDTNIEQRNERKYDAPSQNQQLITKYNYLNTKPYKKQSSIQVPGSVLISTATTFDSKKQKLYKPQTIVDGPAVTIIEGVRVPDMPEDQVNTWRNARVLNNQLMPYPQGYTPPRAQLNTFDR